MADVCPIGQPAQEELPMRFTRSVRFALPLAYVALFTACHDGAAPRSPATFDVTEALAKTAPLTSVFDQPVFKSYQSIFVLANAYLGSPAAAASASLTAERTSVSAPSITRLVAPAALISANAVPVNLRGRTLVYDATTRSYVVDPAATGAPASGVRLIIYAWDVNSGQPASPLTRIGYLDIAPVAGTSGAEAMEATLVRDMPRLTVADFVVSHRTVGGVDSFGLMGSVTDGATTVDVGLDGTRSGSAGTLHLVFNTTLAVRSSGVIATEQLTSDQATATEGGALELRYDGHRFSDVASASGQGRDLQFDGALYATIVFPRTPDEETRYVKPDGSSLSTQEVGNLNTLLERVIVADFFWINVAWP
jgi:hypothetical protein